MVGVEDPWLLYYPVLECADQLQSRDGSIERGAGDERSLVPVTLIHAVRVVADA